jgi:general secretion pathway protein I
MPTSAIGEMVFASCSRNIPFAQSLSKCPSSLLGTLTNEKEDVDKLSPNGSVQGGFSLIEMLVALFVLSVAALALIRLEGATLRSTEVLASRAAGQIVAHNLAVDVLTDPAPPSFGTVTGRVTNGGRNWSWSRSTARTDDVRLVRVTFAVRDEGGRPAGALTVVRPLP